MPYRISQLYNVREYHQPTGLDEALTLIRRNDIISVPVAGGVAVAGEGSSDVEALVDLGGLGLDGIEWDGDTLIIGATTTLQTLIDEASDAADGLLAETTRRTAPWNLRNAATVGGTLAGSNGHNPLTVALAALDAQVTSYDGAEQTSSWVELAQRVASDRFTGALITAIRLTLPSGIGAAYEQVGRTDADHPIVSAAAVAYPDGTTQVAVGGLLQAIRVVSGAEDDLAAQVIPADADDTQFVSDFLGQPDYRRSVAPVLAGRVQTRARERAG